MKENETLNLIIDQLNMDGYGQGLQYFHDKYEVETPEDVDGMIYYRQFNEWIQVDMEQSFQENYESQIDKLERERQRSTFLDFSLNGNCCNDIISKLNNLLDYSLIQTEDGDVVLQCTHCGKSTLAKKL